MADTIDSKIFGILEQTAAVIKVNMQAANINASGRTSDSIHARAYSEGYQLVGGGKNTAPIPTIEIGRPAGNVPDGMVQRKNGAMDVSNTFKRILLQWAKDKGIDMNWGGATMLGRRIAAVGTLRHQNNVDIYSTETRNAMTSIKEEVSKYFIGSIRKVTSAKLHF